MRLKIFLLVLAVLAASAQEVDEQNAEPAEGLEVEDDIEKRDVPELEGFEEEDDRERRDAPEEEEDDRERRDVPETEDFDEEVSNVVKRASGPPSVDSMANDFEKGLGSWWQEKSDKFDWTRHKGSTTSSQTGPSGDHTSGSGYYLYIETSYPRVKGDVAKLKFKGMTKASSVCMSLYYHMYGSAMGTLNIYNNNKKIFTKSGNQGNSWHKAELDLPGPFIDIVIEGITGSSYTSDIAIDDISIAKRACNAPTPSQPPPPPPQPGQCGVSPMSRVIGGVDAKPGSWPWQIGLHRSGRFICGGSLIHRQWIVTAAHCVTQSSPSLYTIRLGDHNRNVNEGTEEEIKAIRVISHPNYNNPRLNNDIALIQLARPATLNSRVGLVCLPDQDYVLPAGSNCYITGWGKIKHPGGSHHILQQAQMPPVTLAECKKKNGNIGIQVNDNMICATKRNTIISGCHGDSGGPYVCKNSAGRWVLQGDVSWGSSSCNINQLYTVFGRVAKFRNWINSYIGVPTAPPSPPPPSTPPSPPPPSTPPTPPLPGSCGSKPSMTRIVGGTQAKVHAWPWQTMLTSSSGRQFCGGSLVHPQFVVTAAHCIVRQTPSTMKVKLGAHYRVSGSTGKEQIINVAQIFAHPQYHKPKQYSNDIAVLKLARPAVLNNAVGTVCMPDGKFPLPFDDLNKKCFITGWGTLASGGSQPNALMQASVPLVSNKRCNAPAAYGGKIHDSMLCAGLDAGGVDACQGDSGGPLVCEFNGRWYLEGATSWGYGCARPNKYGVYALVRYNQKWVETIVQTGAPPPTTPPPTVAPGDMSTDFTTFGNWQQDKSDKFDWTLRSGGTPSSSTGPSVDVSGSGNYAYIETSSPRVNGDNAKLVFRGSYSGAMCMTFFYHMYGATINTLRVFSNNNLVFTKTGNQGNAWYNTSVTLNGNTNVVIEAVAGTSFTGDIAIDNISVVKRACGSPTSQPTPPPPSTPPTPSPSVPTPGQCGVSPMSRVIGGVDAKPGSWPWQIGLHRSGRFICGGSLIHREWIVTAAHCVTQSSPSLYTIRLGDHNRNVNEGTEEEIKAIRVISHPNYNNPRLNNDIALIQLARPATLNSHVGLVCLPDQDYVLPAGSNCYITGWGKIKHPGGSHHILQQAQMPPVTLAECKKKNGNIGIQVNDNMICATKRGTIISGCHGDSGGPYVCKNSAGRWVLQGDVSWGSSSCNINQLYTVFGRVAKFRNWINSFVNGSPPGTPTPPDSMDTDFQTDLGNWKQDTGDQFDWTLRGGSTPSSSTGPSGDVSGSGRYAYIETSSPRRLGDKARLVFRGSYSGAMCMTFFYHMYGSTINTLRVISNNIKVFEKTGNQGNVWYNASVTLNGNKNVVIEAVTGSSYTGDIAIDNISVVKRACGSQPTPPPPSTPPTPATTTPMPVSNSMDTDFQTDLGNWKQDKSDKFDWTLRSGGTPSSSTGPSGDVSGSGKYAYIETSSPRVNGDNAKLVFRGSYSGAMCMTFFYHMYGSTINTLRVFSNNIKVFEKTGNQGNVWYNTSVTLNGNTNVVIEAVAGSSYTGDIAIDNISVVKRACGSQPTPPPPSTPPTPATTTPLPLSNSLDTNFDNLGNWKQDTSDNFDWTLRSGSTPSLATGPTNGQGGSGNYAYIETSSPRKEGDKARLVFRGSYSGDMCMNFFYHMYGATINTLRVFSNNKEVFAKNGTQGNAWKKATVTLNGNTNVVIEAVAGSSYTGDIAIDSITSVKGACGCPNVTPSPPLPTVPPTIPPGMTTDFEKNLGLWQQDRNDKFDWTRRSGGTPSYNTGPSSGQGGSGYYVYIETSSPRVNGDKASLVFRGSYSGAMCMTFYYHMYGATINTLRVLSNNNLVFTKNGQQGNSWKKASVTLNGNKNVVIEAVSGSSYTGDIAIDSISVALGKCAVSTPPPPPTGSPPPPGSCGRKPAMSRIVGGKPAKPHDWPWQAMLTTTSGFAFCGGSLVHPQYVVTATHCVTGKSPSSIRIKLGAHYRVSGSTGKEQTINVAQIFTHPQYHKPKRYSNDIAVLKLARPAVLNNAVGTVCMPDKSIPLPFDDLNKKCFITGWGTLASGGSRPNALMQASVPLVSNKRCNAPAAYGGKIGDSMLCAGLDAGGVDACQGDSGGPLVCEFNGRWYLEGATSWGYGCARPNKYGVYALVRYNLNWVQQKINGV